MILYDGHSDIEWFYAGPMTKKSMQKHSAYDALFSEPCVLYDNGNGSVYSFEPLSQAMAKAGLSPSDYESSQDAFDALLVRLSTADDPLTLEGVADRVDAHQDQLEAVDDIICAIYESLEV